MMKLTTVIHVAKPGKPDLLTPLAQDNMNTMTALITFVVLLFATIRITRLIVTDKLSDPFRQFLVDKLGASSWVTYLFFCPWCVSFWVALAASTVLWNTTTTPDWVTLPAWAGIPAVALGMAYVVGWVLTREDSE